MEGKTNSEVLNLFSPITVGAYNLKNRIVMAAMTRCRADYTTLVPNDLHVKYYSERAEHAGFILTECTAISRRGDCFPGACGIWNDEQVEGWKKVVDEVHKVDGKIFLQIWHCGRAALSAQLDGQIPLAPSSIRIRFKARTPQGEVDYEDPQEMTKEDIEEVKQQFRKGAENAKLAGFDGVELHGANGYIIDQFLKDGTNQRTDEYGGSVENRCRFALEVIDILIEVFGSDKVGIKLSPVGLYNDMSESDPVSLYTHLLKELDKKKIAFVELARQPGVRLQNKEGEQIDDVYQTFRPFYSGVLIANNTFDSKEGNEIIEKGDADMVSYGKHYISNPDLPLRFKNNWPIVEPSFNIFFSPGAEGYIDFPKYKEGEQSG